MSVLLTLGMRIATVRISSSRTRALRLLFLLIWIPAVVWALDTDREQPIQITADIAIRDQIAGETRYEGNVVLIQGSLKITADTLSVLHESSDADRIIAIGKPARLIQQPAPEQTPVDASALRIEYIRSQDLVRLLDDARIAQNGSTLSGDQIDYLVSQRSVRAAGTTRNDGQGRVEVVIPPENLRTGASDA